MDYSNHSGISSHILPKQVETDNQDNKTSPCFSFSNHLECSTIKPLNQYEFGISSISSPKFHASLETSIKMDYSDCHDICVDKSPKTEECDQFSEKQHIETGSIKEETFLHAASSQINVFPNKSS